MQLRWGSHGRYSPQTTRKIIRHAFGLQYDRIHDVVHRSHICPRSRRKHLSSESHNNHLEHNGHCHSIAFRHSF